MSRKPHVPSYRLHRCSGQAVVTLSGRDYYLGVYNSPESRAEYERLVQEWLAIGRQNVPRQIAGVTVAEVCAAHLRWAQTYYVKNGKPTAQVDRIVSVRGIVKRLYGSQPCHRFGPLALKAVRRALVDRGNCRGYVNSCCGVVKRAFRWAAAEEMIPASVYEALRTVDGLRAGRVEGLRESRTVTPVPAEWIGPALEHVSAQVAAMARLQLLTAMRPGEVVLMRGADLATSGRIELEPGHALELGSAVWVYRPGSWKTQGRNRLGNVILIGPQGQAVLRPWLRADPGAYLFQPCESVEVFRARQRAARASKVQPSQLDRSISDPSRPPGDCYTSHSYCRAIARACRREMVKRTRGIALTVRDRAAQLRHWHPHQLRHSGATMLASEFGVETARIILRHRHLKTTLIYAEADLRRAAAAILRVG